VDTCNDTGTIRFSNLTAKNIYVESAVYSAFEVGGYRSPSNQLQFTDFVIENFTVKHFRALGSCQNAAVALLGKVSPTFPPCTNSSTAAGQPN